MKKKIPSK
jgi:hypothetical protein